MQSTDINNEKELLQQLASGNEEAFRVFYDRYRPRLYGYLLKLSESAELAEDGVHEVFLKIWTNRQKLSEVENFDAYLFTIARNYAFTGVRRMATETLVMAELSHRTNLHPEEPDTTLNRKEVHRFIQQTVNKLTDRQKEIFILSREMGMKQSEIAEKLGISVSTVKTHIQDALQFLRAEVSAQYGNYAVALFILYNLGY